MQTHDAWQWTFVIAALAIAAGLNVAALMRGRGRRLADRVGGGVEKLTRLPAWAGSALIAGTWGLGVALLGFEWDVAWHADNGRDQELFTVPHVLILIGLGGIAVAAVMAVTFATMRGSRTGWTLGGRLRVPYSAPALALLAAGALAGFPLDDLWHALYGIDVTMWSPTHLLMIGAASLATIALWLLLAEARAGGAPGRPLLWSFWGGTALVGLSTLQLEYDMGIPQWQLLFQPVLIAAAAGIVLVAARAAVGRGGALAAVGLFVVLRGASLLLIGVGLGHTLPRFPIYIGEAVAVEAAFMLLAARARPIYLALACGLGIGTVGLAVEALWINAWYPNQWTSDVLPWVWQATGAAVVGALIGVPLGWTLAGRRSPFPAWVPVGALAVLALVLGYHVANRHPAPDTLTLSAQQAGPVQALRTREGSVNAGGPVALEVRITPAPPSGDQMVAVAWQGHQPVVHRRLIEVSPGVYRADGPLPTGGDWKSIVVYGRGDVLDAAALAMPADPAYRLAPVETPLEPRTTRAVGTPDVLMREFHAGLSGFALAVYAIFLAFVGAWVASLALGAQRIGRLAAAGSDQRAPKRARKRRLALG